MVEFEVGKKVLSHRSVIMLLQSQISSPNRQLKDLVSKSLGILRQSGSDENSKESVSEAHRAGVVRELLETEKTYVENILLMFTVLLPSLGKLAKKDEMQKITSIVDTLLNVHTRFLQSLQKRILDHSNDPKREVLIGDILVELSESLNIYRDYTSNYEKLQSLVDNPRFRKLVEKQREDNAAKFELPSYTSLIITPIQRIPRYELMLQHLLQYLPPEHVDNQNITLAMSKIATVMDLLDQEKGEAESIRKVVAIQASLPELPFEISVPHRRFLKESELAAETAPSEFSPSFLFLLNDLLILTISKDEKLLIEHPMQLAYLRIIDIPSENHEVMAFCIQMFDQEIILHAPTQTEKEHWLVALNEAIEKDRERWHVEENNATHSVKVYFDDTSQLRKLGLSNSFKSLIVNSEATVAEAIEMMKSRVCKSLTPHQIEILEEEWSDYRTYEVHKSSQRLMYEEESVWRAQRYNVAMKLVYKPYPYRTKKIKVATPISSPPLISQTPPFPGIKLRGIIDDELANQSPMLQTSIMTTSKPSVLIFEHHNRKEVLRPKINTTNKKAPPTPPSAEELGSSSESLNPPRTSSPPLVPSRPNSRPAPATAPGPRPPPRPVNLPLSVTPPKPAPPGSLDRSAGPPPIPPKRNLLMELLQLAQLVTAKDSDSHRSALESAAWKGSMSIIYRERAKDMAKTALTVIEQLVTILKPIAPKMPDGDALLASSLEQVFSLQALISRGDRNSGTMAANVAMKIEQLVMLLQAYRNDIISAAALKKSQE